MQSTKLASRATRPKHRSHNTTLYHRLLVLAYLALLFHCIAQISGHKTSLDTLKFMKKVKGRHGWGDRRVIASTV
ncbi:hypothetical protein B9Z19DRAFT_1075604 [Tuber borchii]|uniref:Uncharacterized protein n=1 Tax=Tuber borchii TaxID=42251 RepID=A0A2T7A332_TUBBO|nr:hypothetical protein B9Z19DRAFT_1075604 [Tuber borchii]